MAAFTMELKGVARVLKKLERGGAPILADPMREAIQEALNLLDQAIRPRIPRGPTGQLEANYTTKMDASPVPRWGVVRTEAEARNSFRYGWALNASDRYHYAGSGQPTKGWFTDPFRQLRRRISRMLNAAARAVQSEWGA